MIRTGLFVAMAVSGALLSNPLLAEGQAPEGLAPGDQAPAAQVQEEQAPEVPAKRVYRKVGEDGTVIFTDQGDEGLEEVEIRTPNTVDISVPRIAPVATEEGEEPGELDVDGGMPGYSVRITEPAPEQTFQNPSEKLAVGFKVSPALRKGHKAVVVYDGQVLDGMTIPWPERGEHRVSVRIVDSKGAELAVSESVRFYVQRVSRRLPSGGAN